MAQKSKEAINPFILGKRGAERSFRAFAVKFENIKRDYKVLHGDDILAGLEFDPEFEKFLCEQALRNLRLRLVHHYVMYGHEPRQYVPYLMRHKATALIQLAEVVQLNGGQVPHEFDQVVPVLETELGIDGGVLRDLIELKNKPRKLSVAQVQGFHRRLFMLLDGVLEKLEAQWPLPSTQ